jgi:hypothetical protein
MANRPSDAELLSSSDEEHRPTAEQPPPHAANPVHTELQKQGFIKDQDIGSRSSASRVWKEGLFTMWVKPNPVGGKPLQRFAVCECNPGKCHE